jgi:hypothetical protein
MNVFDGGRSCVGNVTRDIVTSRERHWIGGRVSYADSVIEPSQSWNKCTRLIENGDSNPLMKSTFG